MIMPLEVQTGIRFRM